MKFVVVIPFWLYAVFFLVVFSTAIVAAYVFAALVLLYLFITRPKEAIGLLLIALSVKYWKITLPLLALYFFWSWVSSGKGIKATKAGQASNESADIPESVAALPGPDASVGDNPSARS